MGMMQEFKEFAMKGNVLDMAVGVIIGAAFGKIVDSLVKDVIMPPIGLLMGGVDFAYGDAFPHEANMDLLHGLDFRKGCYVGQEVVSRVEHRGLARKRICRVRHGGDAIPKGVRIVAGDREIALTDPGANHGARVRDLLGEHLRVAVAAQEHRQVAVPAEV